MTHLSVWYFSRTTHRILWKHYTYSYSYVVKNAVKWKMEPRIEPPCLLQACCLPHTDVPTPQKLWKCLCFQSFIWTFITKACLIKSPATWLNAVSSPFPLTRDQRVRLKVLAFQSDCCSVAQLCLALCNSMDCSLPGFPVLHCLSEFAQTSVLWVDDAIQSDAWYHF